MAKRILLGVGILITIIGISLFILFKRTKSFSPETTASYKQNGLEVTITYCQPSKKDRLIFGEESQKALVPYGKIWRTGANEATLLRINRDVTLAGKHLKAGEYSLWTIPGANQWEVVINSQTGQWGTDYDAKKDVFRAPVSSQKTPSVVEVFNISFANQAAGADLILRWDTTQVNVPIRSE